MPVFGMTMACPISLATGDIRTSVEETSLELYQARAVVDQVMQPLISATKIGNEQRYILPFDLPAPAHLWMSNEITASGLPHDFIVALRTLLRLAACRADAEALRAILDFSTEYDGYFIDEAQGLFLERTAARYNLALPFHKRVRTVLRLSEGMSHMPQRILRLSIAFDDGRTGDTWQFVPNLARLCHN